MKEIVQFGIGYHTFSGFAEKAIPLSMKIQVADTTLNLGYIASRIHAPFPILFNNPITLLATARDEYGFCPVHRYGSRYQVSEIVTKAWILAPACPGEDLSRNDDTNPGN